MLKLERKSRSWFALGACVLAVNAISLFFCSNAVNVTIDFSTGGAVMFLAVIAGLLAFVGYFGAGIFSLVFTVGNMAAVIYLLAVSLSGLSQGWEDVTSVAGFLVLTGIGAAAGIVIQIIMLLIRSIRRDEQRDEK